MRRASVSAAGFALAAGLAADPERTVHVSPAPDRNGRLLLACVEPLELSARGMELAGVALNALRETFAATAGGPTEALLAACAAANRAVIAENRPESTGRWDRRICIGATVIALAGREIVIAQAAPSQALMVQDGQVYAFPDIASWRGDYVPGMPTSESHPLGFAEEITPRLYSSEAAPGDLIALCSTSVGRAFGRSEEAAVALHGGQVLTADLEGSVDWLERLLARHDVADAFAVVASISRLSRRTGGGTVFTVSRTPAADSSRQKTSRDNRPRADALAAPSAVPVAALTVEPEGEDARAPAFEGVRDTLIGIAEFISPRRKAPVPSYDPRARALAAPGAMSVSRYREPSGFPAEWRANLPRGPGVHVPARLLAVSLAIFVAIGGTSFAVGQQRDREARAEASLVSADQALQEALANPVSAVSLVNQAESAIADAKRSGAAGDALAGRERDLLAVRDRVWRVQRLENVVRLGALPLEGRSGSVRLALSGTTLYLAAGNLYELDADGRTLVTILEAGDDVEGVPAGSVRDVSIDGGNVVASDGAATYARDKRGNWKRQELMIADVGGLRTDIPTISWGNAIYSLSWDDDIVRFEQTSGGPLAEIWAPAVESPDLEFARDIAIDGRIHVLLEDGRTLTFSRGAQTGTVAPFVHPTLTSAAFLAQAPFSTEFYIIDPTSRIGGNSGRVVRANAAGEAVQLLTPSPEPGDLLGEAAAAALSTAQDMAIDELSGMVYWVSGGEIWQASLPRT